MPDELSEWLVLLAALLAYIEKQHKSTTYNKFILHPKDFISERNNCTCISIPIRISKN